MILTNKRISPIKAGTYRAKIVDIKYFDNVATKKGITQKLLYSFAVFTAEGIIEVKTNVFINNNSDSQFSQFKKSLLKLFETDTLDTDEHIGLNVRVKFSVIKTSKGDEYPQLDWYAPCKYDENETNTKKDKDLGGNNNE